MHWATTALIILTALNFVNYIDRSVLFAVQPLVQREFPGSDARFGLLTTAFFFCYMATAPLIGWLADRYSRRWIMCVGALLWSAATLLTAVTHSFAGLMVRHTLVGVGSTTSQSRWAPRSVTCWGERSRRAGDGERHSWSARRLAWCWG